MVARRPNLERLRVAFDARSLTGTVLRGMDRYTVGLARGLAAAGHEVTLLHRSREPLEVNHLDGLDCAVQPIHDRSGVWWEQLSVPRYLQRNGFDLYHAPAERGVPFVCPCPVVLTLHSATTESYTALVRSGRLPGRERDYLGYDPPRRWSPRCVYQQFGTRRATHILTPSEFARQEILQLIGIPADRVSVTPLAIDTPFLRPPVSVVEREATLRRLGVTPPYLLYVGGYEPHKNVRGLLQAFARVKRQMPEIRLVAVGSGDVPDELICYARQNVPHDRDVVFLANLRDELVDLYDGAELLVSLSWRETFCLPALEAMTRGLPVVGSRWGATPEVVQEAGCLVDPRNEDEAATAIVNVLTTKQRSSLSAKAKEQAARFCWTDTVAKTLEVYRSVLTKRVHIQEIISA